MEHKAFLFKDQEFNSELKSIILEAGISNNPEPIRMFIEKNIEKICSPYTGESIDADWEDELENGGIQELIDFALTCFYSPEDDCGLSYSWDLLLEKLKHVSVRFEAEYYVLGIQIAQDGFTLDPGGMGMGFIKAEDIPEMYKDLMECRGAFINAELPPDNDLLYRDITLTELIEAYDELLALYKDASEKSCGLLMTF